MFNHKHINTYFGGDVHSFKWLGRKNIKSLIMATSAAEEMDQDGNKGEGGCSCRFICMVLVVVKASSILIDVLQNTVTVHTEK